MEEDAANFTEPSTLGINIVGYAKSSSSSDEEESTTMQTEESSIAVENGIDEEVNDNKEDGSEAMETDKIAESHKAEAVERNPEDDLDLPALKRRPKRTIRPVQDKSTVIKFVDSDASSEDEEDRDWKGEMESGGGEEPNSDPGSDTSDQEAKSDDESESESSDDTEDESDDGSIEGAEAESNETASLNNDSEMKAVEEEETAEPVKISPSDMPFLFVPRAAGKRQIKVIQYKNELAEKAKEMSDESSSEDEEWQAKQEDIKEQIGQEEGEEKVDLSNVPLVNENDTKKSKPKKPKEMTSEKFNIPHSEALEISLCCVCLMGPEEDNVLECDACGVTVHEGCYGAPPTDPENDDLDTTWFCEPCIASVEKQQCELCPNVHGVMKYTDSGKWAHMVCALYSEGIGFGDTTRLEPIITTDISPYKFGYKKCDLCEDERFAYAGLVVECDAGLCKSNFHITCAQKLGFCMENTNEDVKTNPFFAYCKVHVDKDIARPKKKAYKLLMEHLNAVAKKTISDESSALLADKRKEYNEKRKNIVVPAVMTERHPRALFGSVSAFTKLTKKAELFGLNTHVSIVEDTDYAEKPIRLIKPDVSVNFAKQYEARQRQLFETAARSNYHFKNLVNLREEEQKLQAEIHELQAQVPKLSKKYEKIRKQAVAIWKFLSLVDPTEYDIPDCLMQKQNIRIKSNVIKKKMGLKYCHTCKHGQAPETMVDCDECHNWFHFGCLDPPVTRNPKVNKRWAWFCTDCTSSRSVEKSEKENRKCNSSSGRDGKDKDTEVKSTKYGRSVKKPDHFKSDEVAKEKPQPVSSQESPKKQMVENVVAIDSFRRSHETHCHMCTLRDCTQKLFCDFCKKHFHLHCTSGSYESGSFVCENCESLTAPVPTLQAKPVENSNKNTEIESAKAQKRKNIFELQYDLMQQKKRKEATETKTDQPKESDHNISADRSDTTLKNLDTDDEITDRDIVEASQEERLTSPPPKECSTSTPSKPTMGSPPPKPSLFSNLLKGIQQAVAKFPEDSKVKLGMSPVKSVKIVEDSSEVEDEKVVSVNVEISESDSNQTVLTILPTDYSDCNSANLVSIAKPAIISQEKHSDSEGSLPDVFSD